MCLEITAVISPKAKNRLTAGRLSELSGLCISSKKTVGGETFHFSVTGGCSCEFLSGAADSKAPTWALEAKHLPALAKAIEILAPSGSFTFLARWMGGERQRETVKISKSALVGLVRKNRVGNNVLYTVS